MSAQIVIPDITIPRDAPITNMVLKYDGVTDFLALPGLLLGQPLSKMSIEFWVFLEKVTGNQSFWQNTDTGSTAFSLSFQNNLLQFGYNSANVLTFSSTFIAQDWYYLVVTYDVTTMKATPYVNAEAGTVGTLTAPQPVKIGPAKVGSTLQGNIGMIRVWNGILDQTHIEQYMYMTLRGGVQARNTSGQVIATLVGDWHCDEGYGPRVFEYSSSSGGQLNGLLGGGNSADMPTWIVSTILKPPDFVTFINNPAFTNQEAQVTVSNFRGFVPQVAPEPVITKKAAEKAIARPPASRKRTRRPSSTTKAKKTKG